METTEDLFKRLLVNALNSAAQTELTVDDLVIDNIYTDTTHAPHANTAVVVSVKTQSNSIYKGTKVFYYTRRKVDGGEYNHYFEADFTKPFFTADHSAELMVRTGIDVQPYNLVNQLTDEASVYLGEWDFALADNHEFFIGRYPMLTQGRYPAVATGVLEITEAPFKIVTNEGFPATLVINGTVAKIEDGLVTHGLLPGRYPFYFSGAGIDAVAVLPECRKLFSFSSQFGDLWRTLSLSETNLEEIGGNLSMGKYLTIGQFTNMSKLTTVSDDWGLGNNVDTQLTTLFVDCPVLTTVGRFSPPDTQSVRSGVKVSPLIQNAPKLKSWGVDYRSITTSDNVSDLVVGVGTETLTGTVLSPTLLRDLGITVLSRFAKDSKIALLPATWFGLNQPNITTIQGAVTGEVITLENDLFAGFSSLFNLRNFLKGARDTKSPVTLPPFLFRGTSSTLTDLETVFSDLIINGFYSTTLHGLQPIVMKRMFYQCDFKDAVVSGMWNITHNKPVETNNLYARCIFNRLPVGNSLVPQTTGSLDATGLLEGATVRDGKLPSGFFDGTNTTVVDDAFAALNNGTETITVPNGFLRDLTNLTSCNGVFRGTRVAFAEGAIFPNVADLNHGCLGAKITGPTSSILAGCKDTTNLDFFFNNAIFDDVSSRTFSDCRSVENLVSLCEGATFNAQPPEDWFEGLVGVKTATRCFANTTVTFPERLLSRLVNCESITNMFDKATVRFDGQVFVGLPATNFSGNFKDATIRGSLVQLFTPEQARLPLDCTGLFQGASMVNLSHGKMYIPANGTLDYLFTKATNTRTLTVYEFCEWCGFGGENIRTVDTVPTDWLVDIKWVTGSLTELLTILLGHPPSTEELDNWKPSVLGSGIE